MINIRLSSLKILLLVSVILIGCGGNNSELSDNDIGIRKAPLENEKVVLQDYTYSITPAGESKIIERAFENAPPMIPHDVEGMMDISKDFNACITCHSPEMAPIMNATPIPSSHTYDTFKNKPTKEIADIRFNCNLCHTPQADVKPIIGNNFKPDFRNELSKKKSNLLDVLDEGVK
ncbi:nitrate reductase cytochrome c-type subunit [Helicobacter sp. MIT 14-3879]|uniref:nitrate reductase cytochrome c-type subunit n=1 Tax=Helicobacter sp. MIT 14-3879 TaxID=2040649 RepID=UPI000E1E6BCE|nr:nitrate reductase cytochrome c-type subunit [Helicobacter sp. MIT 14-3879]RDU63479.1 nitrate reductase [Helicobacter sp. MIT 14-3879]